MARRARARWRHPHSPTVVVRLLEDVWNRATDGNFISHNKKDVQRMGMEVCGGDLFFRRGKFAFLIRRRNRLLTLL